MKAYLSNGITIEGTVAEIKELTVTCQHGQPVEMLMENK